MGKTKTRTSATKRFTVSKNGKLMKRSQSSRHLKSAKSTTQKRRGKEPQVVYKAFAKKIKRMM